MGDTSTNIYWLLMLALCVYGCRGVVLGVQVLAKQKGRNHAGRR
jgi:hypothetical protein